MTTFDQLLAALYEIQGLSDPNAQATPELMKENLERIFDLACEQMIISGYQPD